MNKKSFVAHVITERFRSETLATIPQQIAIAHEFKERGYSRKQKLVAISEFCNREVISTSKLFYYEANAIISEMNNAHFWQWVDESEA